MALIGLYSLDESDRAVTSELSDKLSIPILSPEESELSLIISGVNVFIRLNSDKTSPNFQPDFSSAKMEVKVKDEIQRRGLLLKAIEGRSKEKPFLNIFDFYSGFAMDAFLLACAGHTVMSCEKNPVISFITKMAWKNQKEESWVSDLDPQLILKNVDSKEFLRNSSAEFDVIYMDPMFEKLKSSAKSPLPMQIIQTMLQDEGQLDFEGDFNVASTRAHKIVVKLPLKGRSLLDRAPSHQIFGKTIRYDVFQNVHLR